MPCWSLNYVKIWYQHSWLLGSNSIFLYKLLDFLCLISPALLSLWPWAKRFQDICWWKSLMWNKSRRYLWSRFTQNHIFFSLCFPWRFSSSAFWMTVLSSASTAELRYQGTFCVMTWSSSWHSFISRHMSFPGILWLPTCVFAKHLALRECCNVPDLLAEAGKQPYVTIQTVICWPYPMKVWWSRVPGLSSKNPKQHVVSWEGCTSVAWWTGQQELSETTGSLRTLGRQYCLDRSSSTCCPLPVSVKQGHVKDWEGFATAFCLGEATGL